jgi:hypothetical protein
MDQNQLKIYSHHHRFKYEPLPSIKKTDLIKSYKLQVSTI